MAEVDTEGSGWITFAGIMLVVAGVGAVLDAIWAFRFDNRLNEIEENLLLVVFDENLTFWGWVWLILGALLIAAGIAVFFRQQWARWVGIIAASLAILGNISWAQVQPTQAFIGMILAALVIYGLAAHGDRGYA